MGCGGKSFGSFGQLPDPVEDRQQIDVGECELVLLPDTEVEFEFDGKVVRIVRAKTRNKESRGGAPCRSFTRSRRYCYEHRRDYGTDSR
jgi:hypothetical protein